MSEYCAHVQFWARLTFENEAVEQYVRNQEDLSKAPWRPSFYYSRDAKEGYMIFPIAREGEEFGFYTLNPEFWTNVHQYRIQPGVEFLVGMSSKHIAATGVVTRMAGP